ncbi:hypothetical protein C0Q70_00680 [Pomacea canaliculata]|uniref:Uncharacterized protein n=1 Tax=Pomacea canaliculata TaxID=400727 RepID=A0A2T7PXD4_POMCA|nr:hypothetical protein C0Q70_00680 [Pomacea canaliculata]
MGDKYERQTDDGRGAKKADLQKPARFTCSGQYLANSTFASLARFCTTGGSATVRRVERTRGAIVMIEETVTVRRLDGRHAIRRRWTFRVFWEGGGGSGHATVYAFILEAKIRSEEPEKRYSVREQRGRVVEVYDGRKWPVLSPHQAARCNKESQAPGDRPDDPEDRNNERDLGKKRHL